MSQMRSGRRRPRSFGSVTILGAGLLPVALSGAARAETVGPGPAAQLDELSVVGEGPSRGIVAAYAGGQVAQGGRAGLLGNIDTGKSPFSVTSYTDSLVRDRQYVDLANTQALPDWARLDLGLRYATVIDGRRSGPPC